MNISIASHPLDERPHKHATDSNGRFISQHLLRTLFQHANLQLTRQNRQHTEFANAFVACRDYLYVTHAAESICILRKQLFCDGWPAHTVDCRSVSSKHMRILVDAARPRRTQKNAASDCIVVVWPMVWPVVPPNAAALLSKHVARANEIEWTQSAENKQRNEYHDDDDFNRDVARTQPFWLGGSVHLGSLRPSSVQCRRGQCTSTHSHSVRNGAAEKTTQHHNRHEYRATATAVMTVAYQSCRRR